MIKVLIRKDGFQDVVMVENGVPLHVESKEGDRLVDIGSYNDHVKPKYVDGKWVESATDKEIKEYEKSINKGSQFDDLFPKVSTEPKVDDEKVAMAMAIIDLENRIVGLEGGKDQ